MLEELLNFTEGKEMEWRNNLLVMWVDPEDLREFAEVLGNDFLCEGGLQVTMGQDGVIAIELNYIVKGYDFKLEDILPRD